MQLDFRYAPGVSELTLVTPDRALLFANMAGALAAWGMNIVTADAFSNRQRRGGGQLPVYRHAFARWR